MPEQDLLINAANPEECRIAVVEGGKLEQLYAERTSDDLHVSNIYRGRITNVEPAIQAAFVDFGEDRSGFLHISDVHPRYFPGAEGDAAERVGYKTPRRDRPSIQACFKRGQRVVVQILKEGIGTKGPTVTSYLSIPGRFIVMMPFMERQGVSRKIEDPEKRKQIRKILDELDPPEGFGFIVRTAGLDQTKTELKRDLAYLMRLWKDLEKKQAKGRGPVELYTESDLIIRTLRDVVTKDVKRVVVDDRKAAVRAKDFLRLSMPRSGTQVFYHDKSIPLFDAFDIERQIQQISERQVPLPSGGSLVFDQTEALVAIDVNSGKSRSSGDAETNAYKTNCEAVDEIARQLRLRDLGGLVVLDLIDMYMARHRSAVEKRFRDLLKKDRARTKTVRISELGMMEMTRQRMRPSLKKSTFKECGVCAGAGLVLNAESVVLRVMRQLAVVLSQQKTDRVEVSLHPEAATMLLNRRRSSLVRLEERTGKKVHFSVDAHLRPDEVRMAAFTATNAELDLDTMPKAKAPRFTKTDEITVEDLGEIDDLMSVDFDEASLASEADADTPTNASGEPADPDESAESASTSDGGEDGEEGGPKKKRRRRRRGGRGRRKKSAEGTDEQNASDESNDGSADGSSESSEPVVKVGGYEGVEDVAPPPETTDGDDNPGNAKTDGESEGETESEDGEGAPKKKRRRRRRGGRGRRKKTSEESAESNSEEGGESSDESADDSDESESVASDSDDAEQPAEKPKRKRSRRRKKSTASDATDTGEATADAPSDDPEPSPEPEPADA